MPVPADRLLAPNDPPPVRMLRPDGRSDFVLTADHARRAIPMRLGMLGLPESELARHIAWDIGIAGVTDRLSQALDAATLLQNYSRLVIDCNRQPGLDSSIPTISELTIIPGNQNLSPEERDARRQEIFQPYHDRIEQLLEARRASGRRTLLIAMHSFTPVFKSVSRTVEIGILYNRDARLPHIMLDLLRREGDLTVGDNEPYAVGDLSDYTVPVHGEQRGLPHVEIEIRQDLIADAAGQARWAGRLTRLLPQADAQLRKSGQ
jgi:predicted N-formylglutamate amidohydrolase